MRQFTALREFNYRTLNGGTGILLAGTSQSCIGEAARFFPTPRLDLDCIYGDSPRVQPYMYENNKKHFVGDGFTGKFLTGKIPDSDIKTVEVMDSKFDNLPRNIEGRALIGDMCNDENAIVAQIHLAFLLAHNALVNQAEKAIYGNDATTKKDKDGNLLFTEVRNSLCRLYQWIVWHDFLKRVTLEKIHKTVLRSESSSQGDKDKVWCLGLKKIYNWKDQSFMPVEFSAAAYRFGYSMVRDSYQTNSSDDVLGLGVHVDLFDGTKEEEEATRDLRGFRTLGKRQVVQWNWFPEMRSDPNSGFQGAEAPWFDEFTGVSKQRQLQGVCTGAFQSVWHRVSAAFDSERKKLEHFTIHFH